eukprot:490893_1
MSAPIPNTAPLPTTAAAAPIPTTAPLTNTSLISPLPPNLLQKKQNDILKKYIPNQKMRFLAWKRLKADQIKDTMFENITLNEDNIQLDMKILDALWSVSKSNKKGKKPVKSKNDEQKSTQNEGKQFLGGMWLRRCVAAILFRFNKLKNPQDIKSVKDVINDIKNVEDIQDINYLDKIEKLMPWNDEMEQFKNHTKILQLKDMNETEREKVVNKFPFLERFWYYCSEIPGIAKRCRLQMLRLEVEEFVPFEYDNIKALQNMYTRLYNNDQICKMFELVLNIGNYLNYPRTVKGCAIDTFYLLKYSRSNRDQKYSLLIYLVEMVNDNYPELANWVDVFGDVRRHDLLRMRIQFEHIQRSLTRYRNENVLNQQMQKILDKMDSDFKEVETEYNKTVPKCNALAAHLGTLAITAHLPHCDFVTFCQMLINIRTDWKSAQNVVERAKNIYIALVCGFIRKLEKNLMYEIPSDIIWWIYVYFPRWSLSSISNFLELHEYQLNQYIDIIPNRLPIDNDKEFIQHKPSTLMKSLQWTPITNIDNSIFKRIEENKQNVCLDFQLLEELWCKGLSLKDSRRKIKVGCGNSVDKNFVEIDNAKSAIRESILRFMSRLLFKNNPKGLRDVVLKIDEIKDIQRLKTLLFLVPTEKEMDAFICCEQITQLKNVQNVDEIVCKFPLAEQLWFYCMDIPLILKRCQLRLLKLEVDEFCAREYENIQFLRGIYSKLYNDAKILKISELILFIGNYLNYNHRSLGNAKGFSWMVFNEMRTCTAVTVNNVDYSLLIYLVDMVDENYPQLSNWVDVFNDVEKCLKIDFHEINYQIGKIVERIDGFRQFMCVIEDESKDSDALKEKMINELDRIDVKMDKLKNDFTEAVNLCQSLSTYFGLKKGTWSFYFTTFIDIKNDWKELQRKMEKPVNVYNNIVNAYCLKFGSIYLYEKNAVSLQIIDTIYLYLSKLFRCDLIS